MQIATPEIVTTAHARAEAAAFALSCEPEVGALLSLLAAALPAGGRILELGTGAGVGLAWLVHGLGDRTDTELITVELDEEIQRVARRGTWPPCVRFVVGDGAQLASTLGQFDLVFADAPGGKLFALQRTIAALAPRGILVVDDMDLRSHDDPELRAALVSVREQLLGHPDLLTVEIGAGSGVLLAARRA